MNIGEDKSLEKKLQDSGEEINALLNSSQDIVLVIDPQGVILRINDCAAYALKGNSCDLIGKRAQDLLPINAGTMHMSHLSRALQSRQSYHFEDFSQGRYFSHTLYPVIEPSGEVARFIVIAKDITDRNRMEEELRKVKDELETRIKERTADLEKANRALQEDIRDRKLFEDELKDSKLKYETIFENTGEATIIIEDDTTISLANSEFEKISGYPKSEIEGIKSWTEFVVPEDLERLKSQHRLRRENPEIVPKCFEFRSKDKNGKIRDIFVTMDIIPGTRKSIASLLDITEQKNIEQALKESEQRYRTLFEDSPVAMLEEDFSAVKRYLDLLRDEGVTNLESHLRHHPEIIAECVSLVKIIDINRATLDLHMAKRKEDLINNFTSIHASELSDTFIEELLAIWNDERYTETYSTIRTCDGSTRSVHVRWSIPAGYEKNFSRVFISLTDITESKRLEDALRNKDILLAGVALATNILLTETDPQSAVNQTLELLGVATDVDRILIFEHYDFETDELLKDLLFEWTRDEVLSLKDITDCYLDESHFNKMFIGGHPIKGLNQDFPQPEREKLALQNVKSLLMIPISIESRFLGFIRFDDCHSNRVWINTDISILQLAAASIGGAIARYRAENDL